MDPEHRNNNNEESGLIHVSDREPGYYRKRRGRGFAYFNEKGERISDTPEIERIRKIAIPPAWNNVWISRAASGYLQATGTDKRNRKQYLYHEKWNLFQQENKFRNLEQFGLLLPVVRSRVEKDLKMKGWPREKVVALVIAILDRTYLRIGNPRYFRTNGTQGLTTLRRKNITVGSDFVAFHFLAKGRRSRKLKITSTRFARLIKECSELPGYEIFRYIDESGKTVPVSSADVNAYLQDTTGYNFTTRNFRTWGGTVLAVKKFTEESLSPKGKTTRREVIREVASELANTISVAGKYYIHPAVLEAIENDFPADDDLADLPEELDRPEKIALAVIRRWNTNHE